MVVLDTHVLVWWVNGPHLLSRKAAKAIAAAEQLAVPAIVFWELSMFVRKRKLDLGMPVREWAAHVRAIPRLEAVPLTTDLALLGDSLLMHPDPADRFIVATAIQYEAPLITKDVLLRPLKMVKAVW